MDPGKHHVRFIVRPNSLDCFKYARALARLDSLDVDYDLVSTNTELRLAELDFRNFSYTYFPREIYLDCRDGRVFPIDPREIDRSLRDSWEPYPKRKRPSRSRAKKRKRYTVRQIKRADIRQNGYILDTTPFAEAYKLDKDEPKYVLAPTPDCKGFVVSEQVQNMEPLSTWMREHKHHNSVHVLIRPGQMATFTSMLQLAATHHISLSYALLEGDGAFELPGYSWNNLDDRFTKWPDIKPHYWDIQKDEVTCYPEEHTISLLAPSFPEKEIKQALDTFDFSSPHTALIFLVRPNAIQHYQKIRTITKNQGLDFDLELYELEQEFDFDFP